MKRIVFIALMLATAIVANGQTALYKRFADRPGVQAYCVDRYPLKSGDSVCVTLLQTDDSAVYKTLCRELHDLPYTPRGLHINGTIRVAPSDEGSHKTPEGSLQQKADSLAQHWREHKHLVVFNADGLPGDRGYYTFYCPSDRMVVLAFLITDDKEAWKIPMHMMATEF